MNKAVLIGAVVVVVVAGGAWMLWGRGGAEQGAAVSSTQPQSGNIAQLMSQGTSRCTVSSTVGGVSASGVVYVHNGKVRGDFTTSMPQTGEIASHMIVRDGYVHVWSQTMPQGFKMLVDATASAQAQSSQPDLYAANYNYNCTDWQADESQFALPGGVTFTEFNATGGATGPSCAQCDMAPVGTARDQCRAALNCN